MKGYIEERAVEIANYIIDNNATVRQTAKQFGISKSTVHTVVRKMNVLVIHNRIRVSKAHFSLSNALLRMHYCNYFRAFDTLILTIHNKER